MNNSISVSRYRVSGMDCAACGTKVSNAVRRLKGVRSAEVAVSAELLSIEHDGELTLSDVRAAVAPLGYIVADRNAGPITNGQTEPKAADQPKPWWRNSRTLLTAACGLALIAAYALGFLFPSLQAPFFLTALAVGLIPVARRAIVGAIAGTPFSIEMLMTIAAVGAVIIGAAEEAAVVVLLFLVGEMLEGVATDRARASIQSLTALIPKTALLVEGETVREVEAAILERGCLIRVRPGDRIPADGEIRDGESSIDESPVTGESAPRHKRPGELVFAGTINLDAAITVKVTSSASDNTIARVVRLVEEAQEQKAPTERFIERFSRYYTPSVIVLAALVAAVPPVLFGAAWSEWVYKSLAVLLIGCPCALVISTPAAIASALSGGARQGLLVKGGGVLEQAGKLTAIAFDKTGTLTAGKPKVTDIVAIEFEENRILSIAASLEQGSSHPLALAILESARQKGVAIPPATDMRAMPGKGVSGTVGGKTAFLSAVRALDGKTTVSDELRQRIAELNAEGKTVSLLVFEGKVAGLIAMRDEPRADAARGLTLLREANIRTIMLTGDNVATAQTIGSTLGIEVRGELLPKDKLDIVNKLRSEGYRVGKVGDGINDAPALAAADIGIAMGGGTDVALETADAAVLHGRVSDVARLVELSRRTMRNIYQNIAISLGLKAVFLVTTVIGVTGLWPAILADTGATVLVTANAMRLLRYGVPKLSTASKIAG